MKKVLTSAFAVLCIALAMVSCKPKADTSLDFDKLIREDFATAQDSFRSPVFYEASVKFDKNFTEDGLNAIELVTVVQDLDSVPTCIITTHVIGQEKQVEYVNDYWLEDVVIPLDSVKLTLSQALESVKNSEYVPESNVMVLRNPLGPVLYEYPFYIFGNMGTGYVFVNAGTGSIEDLSASETEESEEVTDTISIAE